MPRSKRDTGVEPKTRSRTGCWPCKARKVKCGEERPVCTNCTKNGEVCDYSIRLNWGGRSRKDKDGTPTDGGFTFISSPTGSAASGNEHEHVFSAQHIAVAPSQRPPSSHPADMPASISKATKGNFTFRNSSSSPTELRSPDLSEKSVFVPPYPPANNDVQSPPRLAEHAAPTSAPTTDEFSWSSQHRAKRTRLHSPMPARSPAPENATSQTQSRANLSPSSTLSTSRDVSSHPERPNTPDSFGVPASPWSMKVGLSTQETPDLRRLSVKSLLSEDATDEQRSFAPPPRPAYHKQGHRSYGYDHGFPDLDVPHNDDHAVIRPRSPDMRRASIISCASTNDGETKQMAFEPHGYYAEPVLIHIPRALEPLPAELVENQMNLLYFHHFINHTGRILVPHDCPENPFRSVLPQLAVRNQHLLHLLLAFSASHRAKLLDHPEPANRIAGWMSDVIPALRAALEPHSIPSPTDPLDPASLAPLATAIMLASLEIVTPNTFPVRISWQQHLEVAKQMIVARGGLHHLAHSRADGARDKAIFFLSRWFAYLDVLGSLSNRLRSPLFGAYREDGGGMWLVNRDDTEVYQIDCFFGFTGRCIALLAQVAELAAQCDAERIDPATNTVRLNWQPESHHRTAAEDLQSRLHASATAPFRGCMHASSPADLSLASTPSAISTPASMSTPSANTPPPPAFLSSAAHGTARAAEISATNTAFHYAGHIYLSRRVLNLPASDPQIQSRVALIRSALLSVRRGSSAESCLIWPIFVAGCESISAEDREVFEERLQGVEGWGMPRVRRARELMRTVWEQGGNLHGGARCGWEMLAEGEFFG